MHRLELNFYDTNAVKLDTRTCPRARIRTSPQCPADIYGREQAQNPRRALRRASAGGRCEGLKAEERVE